MKKLITGIIATILTCGANAHNKDYRHYYEGLPIEIGQVSAITFPDRCRGFLQVCIESDRL